MASFFGKQYRQNSNPEGTPLRANYKQLPGRIALRLAVAANLDSTGTVIVKCTYDVWGMLSKPTVALS